VKHDLELFVILHLERLELLGELGIRLKHLAKPDERSNDEDAYQAVKRNAEHIPQDFAFLLSETA